MDTTSSPNIPDTCAFCAIVSGTAPAVVVYRDQHTLAFMDINPATRGHVLVIPRRHSRDLLDVPETELIHVMHTVQSVAKAIECALTPDGINLIQANRRAAFQSVYHFHVHVIPRWWDDGLVPIRRHIRENPEVLREVGQRIGEAIKASNRD